MMALDFLCTILCVMAWWRRRNSRSLCVDSMEADRRSGNVKGPPSATAKSIEKGVISRKGEIFPSDKILLLGPRLIFASLHCSRKCRTITLWCKFIPPPSAKNPNFFMHAQRRNECELEAEAGIKFPTCVFCSFQCRGFFLCGYLRCLDAAAAARGPPPRSTPVRARRTWKS